jgi:hypothetical protein
LVERAVRNPHKYTQVIGMSQPNTQFNNSSWMTSFTLWNQK